MRRRVFRGRSRQSSSRKTRWTGFLWQGDSIALEARQGTSSWVSFWAKWPGDGLNDDGFPEPSDETLVRYVGNVVCGLGLSALVPGLIPPVDACFGLIAFDGGQYPEYYDNNAYQELSSGVAPPHPIVNADDDWIIRLPMQFVVNGSYQGPADATFLNSQAKRKLPPGTGILAVFGVQNVTTPNEQVYNYSFSWDGRLAVRTGYTR